MNAEYILAIFLINGPNIPGIVLFHTEQNGQDDSVTKGGKALMASRALGQKKINCLTNQFIRTTNWKYLKLSKLVL